MHDDDRLELPRQVSSKQVRQALPGKAVGQVEHERLTVQEARERRERVAEALALALKKPVQFERPAAIERLPRLVGKPVARDDGHLPDARLAQPVERVSEQRTVRHWQKGRRRCLPVADPEGRPVPVRCDGRLAGEDDRLGGCHR